MQTKMAVFGPTAIKLRTGILSNGFWTKITHVTHYSPFHSIYLQGSVILNHVHNSA
uniref:Uncharacterized protein n=1 Tax=Anguilla anguilla TaxID=7936 RepID=A0A0E9SBJ0_ANGAN